MEEKFIKAVAECLVFHRIIGDESDLNAANFKSMVRAFQSSYGGLLADGVPGSLTAWALQAEFAEAKPQLKSVGVAVDSTATIRSIPMNLRSDAAAAAQALFTEVRDLGGIVTSAGGFRGLSVRPNAHQSARSMHYPGLAFDLAVSTGGFNVDTDPFVLERTGATSGRDYWRVWCRASGGAARTFEATYHTGGWDNIKPKKKTETGNYVNFSDLARKHGFQSIGPRSGYLSGTNKKYMSSEWWHFQYEAALVPHFSQLGIEMLRVDSANYTSDRIKSINPELWDERRSLFKEAWN